MRAAELSLVLAGVVGAVGCTAVPASETPAPAPRALVTVPADTAPRALPPGSFATAGEPTQGGWLRGTAPVGTTQLAMDGNPVPLGADGSFLIAFDRDAGPIATLVATRTDGSRVTQPVQVSKRAWRIEHINAPRRPSGATEDFMAIRQPELDAIAAARAEDTGAQGWRQKFVWPVKARISGLFGSQRIYRGEPGAYHSGIDIAPGAGATYVSPADGVVVLAVQGYSLEGNLLIIDHGMGLNSAFLHSQKLLVKKGDRVTQGQPIGLVGMSGRATGPHLHWSLKWQGARLDPLLFTGPQD